VAVGLDDRVGTDPPVKDGIGAVPEHAATRAASRPARATKLARNGTIPALRRFIVNFDPLGWLGDRVAAGDPLLYGAAIRVWRVKPRK
jgi:hypothetical protein